VGALVFSWRVRLVADKDAGGRRSRSCGDDEDAVSGGPGRHEEAACRHPGH
jgi:hypothetical protein